MRRLLPTSLAGQTVLVLLAGLTVSHLLSMAISSSSRMEELMLASDRQVASRMGEIARVLRSTPADERDRIVEAIDSPSLRISLNPESTLVRPEDEEWRTALIRRFLASMIEANAGEELIVRLVDVSDAGHPLATQTPVAWISTHAASMVTGRPADHSLRVSICLHDGQWVNFASIFPASESLWSGHAVLSTVLMTVAVALLSLWGVRRMTRPLEAFAKAAERLGRDVNAPPLPEAGPLEIRQAARAFNDMQQRLRRLIENRTRMLSAISHDLRTPLTLLRLRAEYIQDEEERRKTMATLDDMDSMIASTLAFAREDAEREERRLVDLTALVGSVCDDLADAGLAVEFDPPPTLKVQCRSLAIKRAVFNLIDNAIKYGGNARVRLQNTATLVEIVVEDDGPGIPKAELEEVFAPFYRLEGSRSRETGGVGLGLSVASSIVHAHGGEILLANREEGGLRAIVRLPR